MNPNNAKDLLLTTDYPIDKIVFTKEGSILVQRSIGYAEVTFNTGLDILIGFMSVYSLYPDFREVFYYGNYDMSTETGYNAIAMSGGGVLSESKNEARIGVTLGFNHPQATITIYYKLIGYPLEDLSIEKLSSSNILNEQFILNTDENYLKLINSGTAFFPLDGSPRPPVTVNHNLGYKPTVLAWIGFLDYEDQFTSRPYNEAVPLYYSNIARFGGDSLIQSVINVTDTEVIFHEPGIQQAYTHFFYRIYADEIE